MPPRAEVWSAPVRFVECDQQGVVFNAHYLVWADEAVNAWWDERGVPWASCSARGLEYFVVASALEWRSSARWGDTVDVDVDVEKLGRTSLHAALHDPGGGAGVLRRPDDVRVHRRRRPTPWPDDVRGGSARLTASPQPAFSWPESSAIAFMIRSVTSRRARLLPA